jgi:hypothetical protein
VNAEASLQHTAKEATMQPNSTRPNLAGIANYVSVHRFRLLVVACALALAVTLAAVYGTVGLALT